MAYVGSTWRQVVLVFFFKTFGVAEAWDLAKDFAWGRRNYALSNPQRLKFMFPLGFRLLRGPTYDRLFVRYKATDQKIHKTFFCQNHEKMKTYAVIIIN